MMPAQTLFPSCSVVRYGVCWFVEFVSSFANLMIDTAGDSAPWAKDWPTGFWLQRGYCVWWWTDSGFYFHERLFCLRGRLPVAGLEFCRHLRQHCISPSLLPRYAGIGTLPNEIPSGPVNGVFSGTGGGEGRGCWWRPLNVSQSGFETCQAPAPSAGAKRKREEKWITRGS
jgi:hypothetical protein